LEEEEEEEEEEEIYWKIIRFNYMLWDNYESHERESKVKLNLTLCLTKHHAMKTYWGVADKFKMYLHDFDHIKNKYIKFFVGRGPLQGAERAVVRGGKIFQGTNTPKSKLPLLQHWRLC
jgi:hypothetical protein